MPPSDKSQTAASNPNGTVSNSDARAQRLFTPSRRAILRVGAIGAATGAIGLATTTSVGTNPEPQSPANAGGSSGLQVFQHSVASGDPLPDSVFIWTRATSHSGDTAGANQGRPVALKWEVAPDEGFGNIVASGALNTDSDADNTVKIDVKGFSADSYYFYCFTAIAGDYAGQVSPTGQTRTAPSVNSSPDRLGIALTSRANWESGFFSVYRDMAENDRIDIIMCVGDYIYEYEAGGYSGKGPARDYKPAHGIISPVDYRPRYATCRTGADLQEAYHAKSWTVTWDDYEVVNDDWHSGAENHDPETEGDYIARCDAAIQVYLGWLSVCAVLFSQGGKLYRSFRFGDLADLTMLDLRTYRDQQLKSIRAGETDDESRSMLGSKQLSYLLGQWRSSSTKWRVVGNSVMFTQCLVPPLDPEATCAVTKLLSLPQDGLPYNLDQWDGYVVERREFTDIMDKEGYDSVISLTGDICSSWNYNIPKVPGQYPSADIAATEVVCTSVSAPNIDDIMRLPQDNPVSLAAVAGPKAANPYVNYLESDHHGYAVVYFGREDVTAEYRLAEVKEEPNQPLSVAATYQGRPGQGTTQA